MARRLKVGFFCQPYDLVLPPVQNSIGLWVFEEACKQARISATSIHSGIPYPAPFLGSPLAIFPHFNLAIDK